VLLDCGAFPIQSKCTSIVTQLKNIVVEDTNCYQWLDKWMSLNHNDAIRIACENTGSEANSHNYMGKAVMGGFVDADHTDQVWEDDDG
jgi:hypothetical protein